MQSLHEPERQSAEQQAVQSAVPDRRISEINQAPGRGRRAIRIGFAAVAVLVIAGILLSLLCNSVIAWSARDKTFTDIEALPHRKVGIVLGTSPYTREGRGNPYFANRMAAAARLYHAGKIDFILASGDNRDIPYNEPMKMRKALIQLNVPSSKIILDYAGFRTLDSIVRARKVFGEDRITVISQRFHNQRAIFIGTHYGVDAIGFDAAGSNGGDGFNVKLREFFARIKAIIDVFILETQPKFLGPPIPIG
jgi:SanA protein